jgi:hypothetical protein
MNDKIELFFEEISKIKNKTEIIEVYKELIDKIESLLNEEHSEKIPRRNTLATESEILNSKELKGDFKALEAQYTPIFATDITNFIFINATDEMAKNFDNELSQTVRFNKEIKILEKAVLLKDFISIGSCNTLMNVFLQVANSDNIHNKNILEGMSELMKVWGGQPLSFRISKSNVMLPEESNTPSEIAFYKLEKKHLVFKTLAEELGTIFKLFYNYNKNNAELLSVSLSLRYLVPNQGGNPIHIDAWNDSMIKDGYIYTNQQFSLFLSATEEEEFVVFGENNQKTVQQGNGSLMGFNPTQKHHHPDGHGSWILIIEVILKTKI